MEFQSVETVEAALSTLASDGTDARILAGGTDLVLQAQRGEIEYGRVIHIGRIASLHRITARDGVVDIGALVSHAALHGEPVVRDRFPALCEAAATVGGWQTQTVGTLGGNVCNASPAADTMPPLLIADATARLESERGHRVVPVEELVRGRREIDRAGDELVTSFELAVPPPRTGEVYLKVAPRRAMEVALVGLAVRVTLAEDGMIADARVAVCSVGPRPFRARSAEALLIAGSAASDVAEAGAALADEASPIDDARASARYRRRILPGLLVRGVELARGRAMAA